MTEPTLWLTTETCGLGPYCADLVEACWKDDVDPVGCEDHAEANLFQRGSVKTAPRTRSSATMVKTAKTRSTATGGSHAR